MAVYDQRYSFACIVLWAFGTSAPGKNVFVQHLNRRDSAGDTVYVSLGDVGAPCLRSVDWLCGAGCVFQSAMSLARRLFRTRNRTLDQLSDLLLWIVRLEAADASLANAKGETLTSILGADAPNHIEQQITRIAERQNCQRTVQLLVEPIWIR